MLEFDYEMLSALGLTPALASRAAALQVQAEAIGGGALRLARITEVHRETMAVNDGFGERSARPLPRLHRTLIFSSVAPSEPKLYGKKYCPIPSHQLLPTMTLWF